MKKLLLLILLAVSANAAAQQYLLSGRITDKKNTPIQFVSVYIRNSTYGTTANENGRYELKLKPGSYKVIFRFVGFEEKIEQITITSQNLVHNVQLNNEKFELNPVTVKGKRTRDQGMAIMTEVMNKRQFYMNQIKSYSSAVYIKGVQKLLKAPELIAAADPKLATKPDSGMVKKMLSKPKLLARKAFIRALDLDSNGRGILYQSESLSNFSYAYPNKVKEETIAYKDAGFNTAFGYSKASDLQVDFYQNVYPINGLSTRGFTSPLGSDAFHFYTYKLEGVSKENGRIIDKIQVIPKEKHGQFFKGDIYIVDGEWRIYSVDLILDDEMNTLTLVDTLQISQQYVPVTDSVWMPASVQFNFKGSALGFKFGGYYVGIYNNYQINPVFPAGYFTGEILHVDTAATIKTANYWVNTRPVPLTRMEARDYFKNDSIAVIRNSDHYKDSVERSNNLFRPWRYAIFGYEYKSWRKMQDFYINPIYKTFFYNPVEGWGIDLNGTFTQSYADRRSIVINPVLHYGFADKLFSPHLHATYNYDPDHQGKFYTDFGLDVLDLNNVGTRSLLFNTVSSLLYETNYVKYYRSVFGDVGYQKELLNGLVLGCEIFPMRSVRKLYNIFL